MAAKKTKVADKKKNSSKKNSSKKKLDKKKKAKNKPSRNKAKKAKKKSRRKSNDGEKLETLVEVVFQALTKNDQYTNVQRDQNLPGPDCNRQVDVLLQTKSYGFSSSTMVECKDHARPLDIGYVDAIDSKYNDLPVDLAVLVSRNGFTEGAKAKAKRKNIRLCTLSESVDILDLGLDVQICIVEIFPEYVHFKITNDSGKDFKTTLSKLRFNGMGLQKFLKTSLESGVMRLTKDGSPIFWKKEHGPLEITSTEGSSLKNVEMAIRYERKFFFGLLSQLRNTILFKNLSDGKGNVIYDTDELREYRTVFTEKKANEKLSISKGKWLLANVLVPDLVIEQFVGEKYHSDGTTDKIGDGFTKIASVFSNPFAVEEDKPNTDKPESDE